MHLCKPGLSKVPLQVGHAAAELSTLRQGMLDAASANHQPSESNIAPALQHLEVLPTTAFFTMVRHRRAHVHGVQANGPWPVPLGRWYRYRRTPSLCNI